jgi:hypothetical protein
VNSVLIENVDIVQAGPPKVLISTVQLELVNGGDVIVAAPAIENQNMNESVDMMESEDIVQSGTAQPALVRSEI